MKRIEEKKQVEELRNSGSVVEDTTADFGVQADNSYTDLMNEHYRRFPMVDPLHNNSGASVPLFQQHRNKLVNRDNSTFPVSYSSDVSSGSSIINGQTMFRESLTTVTVERQQSIATFVNENQSFLYTSPPNPLPVVPSYSQLPSHRRNNSIETTVLQEGKEYEDEAVLDNSVLGPLTYQANNRLGDVTMGLVRQHHDYIYSRPPLLPLFYMDENNYTPSVVPTIVSLPSAQCRAEFKNNQEQIKKNLSEVRQLLDERKEDFKTEQIADRALAVQLFSQIPNNNLDIPADPFVPIPNLTGYITELHNVHVQNVAVARDLNMQANGNLEQTTSTVLEGNRRIQEQLEK